jgi:hypothetical protein
MVVSTTLFKMAATSLVVYLGAVAVDTACDFDETNPVCNFFGWSSLGGVVGFSLLGVAAFVWGV